MSTPTLNHRPEQDEAIGLINTSVAEGGSGNEILKRIEEGADELSPEQKARTERYVNGVREETRDAIVKDLDPGVGGMWDGNDVHIATGILVVNESIERTLAQLNETKEHEEYHEENDHTAPIMVMAETKGDIALVMGSQEFTQTGLIEGLTVLRTGDQFVSSEYVAHKEKLERGMAEAGLDVTDIERAVNDAKDLREIDDRAKAAEPEYAIAG